jgi:hypothetical protein
MLDTLHTDDKEVLAPGGRLLAALKKPDLDTPLLPSLKFLGQHSVNRSVFASDDAPRTTRR